MENKYHSVKINIRENRRGNPEWTIQTLATFGTGQVQVQDTGRRHTNTDIHDAHLTFLQWYSDFNNRWRG